LFLRLSSVLARVGAYLSGASVARGARPVDRGEPPLVAQEAGRRLARPAAAAAARQPAALPAQGVVQLGCSGLNAAQKRTGQTARSNTEHVARWTAGRQQLQTSTCLSRPILPFFLATAHLALGTQHLCWADGGSQSLRR